MASIQTCLQQQELFASIEQGDVAAVQSHLLRYPESASLIDNVGKQNGCLLSEQRKCALYLMIHALN